MFSSGHIFGEVGLLMNKLRSASVICNSDCDFATLTADDYKSILEEVDRKDMESRLDFFVQHFFKGMQGEVAMRLCYMFKKSKFIKGNMIFKQGEKSNDLYLIKKGEVQVKFFLFIVDFFYIFNRYLRM